MLVSPGSSRFGQYPPLAVPSEAELMRSRGDDLGSSRLDSVRSSHTTITYMALHQAGSVSRTQSTLLAVYLKLIQCPSDGSASSRSSRLK